MDVREMLRIADNNSIEQQMVRELQGMANPDMAAEQLARLVQDRELPTKSTEKRNDAMTILQEVEDDEQ